MQLKLGFASKPVFAESDFVVSNANRAAFSWIKKWPEWPGNALLLHGPESSGKTHLAHIWAARSGAEFFNNNPEKKNLIIEDIESFGENQERLLHILNESREKSGYLLLTASGPAACLLFTLPDLTSRLKALPDVEVHLPDDELLKSVLIKLFSDRQLKIPPAAIDFILSRIDRSFKSAGRIVNEIDTLSSEEKRNITIPLIRKIL